MNPRSIPVVLCPGCKIEMTVKRVIRKANTGRGEAIVYHCARCDAETTRHFVVSDPLDGETSDKQHV